MSFEHYLSSIDDDAPVQVQGLHMWVFHVHGLIFGLRQVLIMAHDTPNTVVEELDRFIEELESLQDRVGEAWMHWDEDSALLGRFDWFVRSWHRNQKRCAERIRSKCRELRPMYWENTFAVEALLTTVDRALDELDGPIDWTEVRCRLGSGWPSPAI